MVAKPNAARAMRRCVSTVSRMKGVKTAMKKKTRPKIKISNRKARTAISLPTLRFSPTAWAKLLYLRDLGDTEVGGFGISAPDDLLLVEDVRLVRQVCSLAHVAFDDAAVADFFDEQVDQGRHPQQFARLWLHTHPGNCPRPSSTDEETFERVFGRAEWAVMFIVARTGPTYARLSFHVGPGGAIEVPVEVDYRCRFPGCDQEAWKQEYFSNVQIDATKVAHTTKLRREPSRLEDPFFYDEWNGWEFWPHDELGPIEFQEGVIYE